MLTLTHNNFNLEESIIDKFIRTNSYKILIIQSITTHNPRMIDHGNALGLLPLQENVTNYSTFQRSRFNDVVTLGKIIGFESRSLPFII